MEFSCELFLERLMSPFLTIDELGLVFTIVVRDFISNNEQWMISPADQAASEKWNLILTRLFLISGTITYQENLRISF